MHKLLVCDLDGTLLGEERSLRELLDLARRPGAPLLVFATGRQGYSAMAALMEWGVTAGTYLIAAVGSEIFRRVGKRWLPIAGWPPLLMPWDAERVRRELARIPDLQPQPIPVASPYKVSYYAKPSSIVAVRETLRSADIEVTLVHSHGDMLDVLPYGVDKGSAVLWLAGHLAMPPERVMTCGDTANDLAMLRLPCPSVIVGGADPDVAAAGPSLPNAFVSKARCAAGIMDGLRHHGWLNESGWVSS